MISDGDANERQTQAGTARLCGWLTLWMAAAFPVFAAIGYWHSGRWGVVACAVAGGVCWAAALASLFLLCLLRGSAYVPHAFLLGMLFRVGLPLAAGMILSRPGSPLADAGVFGMMVAYYLVGLFVETLLSVRLVNSSAGRAAKVS